MLNLSLSADEFLQLLIDNNYDGSKLPDNITINNGILIKCDILTLPNNLTVNGTLQIINCKYLNYLKSKL